MTTHPELARHEIMTPERLREVLLDPTADASVWVPARADVPGASPHFRRALALSQRYARRALAPGTIKNYSLHWRAYLLWCALAGEDPIGADAVEVVAAHLSCLAAGEVDDGGALVTDDDGRPVRLPLTAATIDLRLAAIGKAFSLLGLSPPGSDPYVRRVKAGIHRELGTYPQHRKAALDLPRLRTVLEAIDRPSSEALRDVALIGLRVLGHLTAGQLSRLRWEAVELAAGSVTLVPPPTTASRRPGHALRIVTVQGVQGVPALDAVLGDLHRRCGGRGPVFPRVVNGACTSTALSDSGVTKILRRWDVVDRQDIGNVASVATALLTPRLIDLRDRALLLTGFAGALRRSNLVAFEWRDFTVAKQGLTIFLRRSKTDQEARGFEVFVPYGHHAITCPVRAFLQWRAAVAGWLGGDPQVAAGRQPVFVGIDRHGNLRVDPETGSLQQLRDDSFNEMVKARCQRAGLTGNFGAHSLRAGFVTTAADNGVPLHEIAEQTGHRSLEALRVYIRRVDRWSSNPLTRFEM